MPSCLAVKGLSFFRYFCNVSAVSRFEAQLIRVSVPTQGRAGAGRAEGPGQPGPPWSLPSCPPWTPCFCPPHQGSSQRLLAKKPVLGAGQGLAPPAGAASSAPLQLSNTKELIKTSHGVLLSADNNRGRQLHGGVCSQGRHPQTGGSPGQAPITTPGSPGQREVGVKDAQGPASPRALPAQSCILPHILPRAALLPEPPGKGLNHPSEKPLARETCRVRATQAGLVAGEASQQAVQPRSISLRWIIHGRGSCPQPTGEAL